VAADVSMPQRLAILRDDMATFAQVQSALGVAAASVESLERVTSRAETASSSAWAT